MIRVDYAGPGGACEGIRSLGLESYGIEWDAAACATRAAAGHRTIRADLSTYRPGGRPEGYWGSPPCQTFSTAGKGDGRAELDRLAEVIHGERWADADLFDPRTRHVIDAARVAVTCGAEWVAMEQVPGVLPLWRALGHVLERHGYDVWSGVLCAADYGVPQTRRRAILMASRVRRVAPPVPTHAEVPGMFGERPWVSMADALGWGEVVVNTRGDRGDDPAGGNEFGACRPSWALTGKARSWTLDRRQQSDGVPVRLVPTCEPAPTVTGIAGAKGQWLFREIQANGACRHSTQPAMTISASADNGNFRFEDADGAVRRLTATDALILQGFDPDYPVQGSRSKQFEQIGNAVPPPLAAHVVASLVDAEQIGAVA